MWDPFDESDYTDLKANDREQYKIARGAIKLGFILLAMLFTFVWSCAIIPG